MRPPRQKEDGFALLLSVLLLMGIGGVVLANVGQQARVAVDQSRFDRNQEVLQKAKSALLLYAYNYPNFLNEGPGRLPCPDLDNDGIPGDSLAQTAAKCATVGRFPFRANGMNFYDVRDADNQRLWYAVSSSFDNFGGPIVNAASAGSITIYDQSGSLLYDGNGSGVAAVIIAPGSEQDGQNRSISNSDDPFNLVADTDPGIVDPGRYLETFGGYSNSAFVDNESDDLTDGLRLGPVYDPASNTIVVNDQMILVTRDELMEVARASVLQTYRDAINQYVNNTARYPWLDDYTTTDLLNFDAELNTGLGRVPVTFGRLFAGDEIDAYTSNTQFRFEPTIVGLGTAPVIDYLPPQIYTDVSFDASGDLLTSIDSSATSVTLRFWDGHPTQTPTLAQDNVWELCTGTAGTGTGGTANPEDDCNLKTDGTFKIPTDTNPGSSDVWVQVVELTVTLDSGALNGGRFTLTDATNLSNGISETIPPDATSHAVAFGTYNASGDWSVTWRYDLDFFASFDTGGGSPTNQSGTLSSINPVSGTIPNYPPGPSVIAGITCCKW